MADLLLTRVIKFSNETMDAWPVRVGHKYQSDAKSALLRTVEHQWEMFSSVDDSGMLYVGHQAWEHEVIVLSEIILPKFYL